MQDPKQVEQKLSPLHGEIRYLVECLGKVLMAQEGRSFFELVESIRKMARDLRQQYSHTLESQLLRKIHSLSLDKLIKVIRAFNIYFQLVNLAEEKHRVRRKRAYEAAGEVQPGSLEDILTRLKRKKISFAKFEKFLAQLSIELVLTAHPTEAQRRSILEKIFVIDRLLFEREFHVLTPREKEEVTRQIMERITLLWQTDELRRRRHLGTLAFAREASNRKAAPRQLERNRSANAAARAGDCDYLVDCGHLSLNRGLRFALNASMPSIASSVRNASVDRSASIRSPS